MSMVAEIAIVDLRDVTTQGASLGCKTQRRERKQPPRPHLRLRRQILPPSLPGPVTEGVGSGPGPRLHREGPAPGPSGLTRRMFRGLAVLQGVSSSISEVRRSRSDRGQCIAGPMDLNAIDYTVVNGFAEIEVMGLRDVTNRQGSITRLGIKRVGSGPGPRLRREGPAPGPRPYVSRCEVQLSPVTPQLTEKRTITVIPSPYRPAEMDDSAGVTGLADSAALADSAGVMGPTDSAEALDSAGYESARDLGSTLEDEPDIVYDSAVVADPAEYQDPAGADLALPQDSAGDDLARGDGSAAQGTRQGLRQRQDKTLPWFLMSAVWCFCLFREASTRWP